MADVGNPNVFTIYKGKYELTPTEATFESTSLMLTIQNMVQFLCDATIWTREDVCTLPEECRPKNMVVLPVCGSTNLNNIVVTTLTINPDGEVLFKQLPKERVDDNTDIEQIITLHLNGLSFSIGDNWYL